MRDTEIVEEVSMRLFKMHMAYCKEYNARNPCSVPMKCNLNEIKANLPDITKYTFTDFRNLKITQPQMRQEVMLGSSKFNMKGPDDLRDVIPTEFMRSAEYRGLLSRLLEQKAKAVATVKGGEDNQRLDIYKDVDRLRMIESIPLGSRCMRSLLNKQNQKLLKKTNLAIAEKTEEALKVEVHDKEHFLAMLSQDLE